MKQTYSLPEFAQWKETYKKFVGTRPCDSCQKLTDHEYTGFWFCDECVYPGYENKYEEARKYAFSSMKYGGTVDPDMMTRKELLEWYRKCLAYDPE